LINPTQELGLPANPARFNGTLRLEVGDHFRQGRDVGQISALLAIAR